MFSIVQGQPGLHSQTISQKKKKEEINKRKTKIKQEALVTQVV
jgi:hypothetical protein